MSQQFDPEELSGPHVDRRTVTKLFGAAGVSALAGCAGDGDGDDGGGGDGGNDGPDPGEVDDDDLQGGRITAGWYLGEVGDLAPAYISVGQYFQISANIFNGLVTLNEDVEIVGDLATDWEVSDDGLRYEFELRDDVTFHNGEAFTAEDVEFTLRHNIQENAPQASRLADLQPIDEGGVEVIGDYTVALNFESPNAAALAHLTRGPGRVGAIINETALEEMGVNQYSLEPVGTGAFEVAEHEVGSHITLDAFDDYHETDDEGNQLPYLDGVDIEMIPEPGTIVNALQAGDIDFANQVPLENVDEVEGNPEIEISGVVGNGWLGFSMNQDREPFDDVDVRRGIAKAIDNELLAQNAFFGYAEPATGVFGPLPEWVARPNDEKDQTQAHDPEEAQELLEGTPLMDDEEEFQIMQTQESLRAARTVQNQLENLGLSVEIDQVTDSTYWERYEDGDYDMTVSGSVQKPDPEESVWNFYRLPDEGGVWNWYNYESQEAHDLLGDQRRAADQDERAEILQELEDVLIRDAPDAYLVHEEDVVGFGDHVGGFTHIPSFLRNFHEVWVEE
ncbi:ABC transporter substrate-binding protein [Halorubrum gandharaense]